MSGSKAPSPIKPVANKPHEKWGDVGKLLGRKSESPPPGMTDVRLTFSDEFSPSSAQAFSSDPNALNNPSGRHIFYNQQLYDLLPHAIDRAIFLGLPPIYVGFPLTFAMVDQQGLQHIFRLVNQLALSIAEGSVEWLCIQCFVRYSLLCNALTEPTDRKIEPHPGESEERVVFRQHCLTTMMPMTEAFFLGASLRELELTLLNKADALRGKRTKKAAKAGGEMKARMTSPKVDARRAEMNRLRKEGHSISNAARLTAKHVGGTIAANQALMKPGRRK